MSKVHTAVNLDKEVKDELDKRGESISPLVNSLLKKHLEGPGSSTEVTTSNGLYMIKDGRLYEFQSYRPGGPGAWVAIDPAAIRQRASGESWKRDLAFRKDAREAESHGADMTIKKVQVLKLQKRYAPETVPQRCRVPGCPIGNIVFKDMTALNDHLREYHPDRIGERSGISLERMTSGEFYGRSQLPEVKWRGQPG